jgi:hypothetical protein
MSHQRPSRRDLTRVNARGPDAGGADSTSVFSLALRSRETSLMTTGISICGSVAAPPTKRCGDFAVNALVPEAPNS